MAEVIFRILVALLFLILGGLGVLIFRRGLRGEEVFKDRDWCFLFGRPTDEVLTSTFWLKVSLGIVVCFLVGLIEYLVLAPYGDKWLVAVAALTALGVVVIAPRVLR